MLKCINGGPYSHLPNNVRRIRDSSASLTVAQVRTGTGYFFG
jgi:hypothetical protein